MRYCEVTLTIPSDALEAATHVLAAHTGGLVLDDESVARLRVYLPMGAELRERLAALRSDLTRLEAFFPGMGALGWDEGVVDERDWAEAWRAHFHPVRIGRRLVVAPTWEVPRSFAGEVVLRLDPGMAFGTGTHASTVLCLEALETLVPGKDHGVDVGTGSGILAVAAVLLGAGRVTACDLDPVAVRVAKENAAMNGVTGRIEVRYAALGDMLAAGCRPADWVVANLTADVLTGLAPDLVRCIRPGGLVVASGVVASGRAQVVASFTAAGLHVRRIANLQGWYAVWAERSSRERLHAATRPAT